MGIPAKIGLFQKSCAPPHRGMKKCFNVFLEFQTILHGNSGIPKLTNREIGYGGTIFEEKNYLEFQEKSKKIRHRGTSFQNKLTGFPRVIEK